MDRMIVRAFQPGRFIGYQSGYSFVSDLRQAEEELEKANNEHGGFRQSALQQTQQAEASVERGIQWYNANVLNKNKK